MDNINNEEIIEPIENDKVGVPTYPNITDNSIKDNSYDILKPVKDEEVDAIKNEETLSADDNLTIVEYNKLNQHYTKDTTTYLSNKYNEAVTDFTTSIKSKSEEFFDSSDVKEIKEKISEYCQLLNDTVIFDNNSNFKKLFESYLNDLYIERPRDALLYLNQEPTKETVISIFNNFGIRPEFLKKFPDILKTKTAFLLNQCFKYKGTDEIFRLFYEVLHEFYKDVNFYNVIIEEIQVPIKYEAVEAKCSYYGTKIGASSIYTTSDFQKMYYDRYGLSGTDVPIIYPEDIDTSAASTFLDESIEFKIFSTVKLTRNQVDYHIKFFDPLLDDAVIRLSWGDQFYVPRGSTEYTYTFKIKNEVLISTYSRANIQSAYYVQDSDIEGEYVINDLYNANTTDTTSENYINLNTFIDDSLSIRVRSELLEDKKVKYYITVKNSNGIPLTDGLPYDFQFDLIILKDDNSFNTPIIIPQGEYSTTLIKDFSTVSVLDDDLRVRSVGDLKYALEPVYITDSNNILEEVSLTDIKLPKYYAQMVDYFETDQKNINKRNVFPITTNIIYMQFNSSDSINTEIMYPELLSMYAMTTMKDRTVQLLINNKFYVVNFEDYINLLMFIRMQEVSLYYRSQVPFLLSEATEELKIAEENYTTELNQVIIDNVKLDELKEILDIAQAKFDYYNDYKFQFEFNKQLREQFIEYNSAIYGQEDITEILKLMKYYEDMIPDHKQLKEFLYYFNNLRMRNNQKIPISITDFQEFKKYFEGDIPDTYEEFKAMLNEYFPDETNSASNSLLNQQIKTIIDDLYVKLEIQENGLSMLDFFDILVSLESDPDFNNLENAVGTYLEQKFTRKYPRLVSEILGITSSIEIVELYLDNYKYMQNYTKKDDKYIQTFINNTFYNYLLGTSYKEAIFDPVLRMFKQYFFKAELTLNNTDQIKLTIKDKLNVVRLDSDESCQLYTNTYDNVSYQDYNNFEIIKPNNIIHKSEHKINQFTNGYYQEYNINNNVVTIDEWVKNG